VSLNEFYGSQLHASREVSSLRFQLDSRSLQLCCYSKSIPQLLAEEEWPFLSLEAASDHFLHFGGVQAGFDALVVQKTGVESFLVLTFEYKYSFPGTEGAKLSKADIVRKVELAEEQLGLIGFHLVPRAHIFVALRDVPADLTKLPANVALLSGSKLEMLYSSLFYRAQFQRTWTPSQL